MPTRQNKNRVSDTTEKILLEYLLSPFKYSGLRDFKAKTGIEFAEDQIKVSNRLNRLRTTYKTDFQDFAELCKKHGVNPPEHPQHLQSPGQSPPRLPNSKPTLIPKTPSSTEKMNLNAASSLLGHQVCLNDDFPSLNDNGMIFFRDDDVEIGESMNSILTIYQPLFDARDYEIVSLKIDPEDPSRLIHTYPGLPTFMIRDYDKVHKLEASEDNPEIYSATKKKHKKLAFKIKGNKQLKLKKTEFELPFELASNKFDEINNTLAEIQKNYRSLSLPVTDKIKQTCSFVFWKIMIQGETQDCFSDVEEEEIDVFHIAQNRARDPPGAPPMEDNNYEEDDPMDESDEDSDEDSADEDSNEGSTDEYSGEGPHVFEDPEERPEAVKSFSNGEDTEDFVPDLQAESSSTAEEIPFVGDVDETEIDNSSVATTALSEHLKRFGRFLSDSNKKAKLDDQKPMDEEEVL